MSSIGFLSLDGLRFCPAVVSIIAHIERCFFFVINQGIFHTNIVIHQDELRNFVGFPAEEMLGLEGDNPCDGIPLLPLDKRSHRRLVLHK